MIRLALRMHNTHHDDELHFFPCFVVSALDTAKKLAEDVKNPAKATANSGLAVLDKLGRTVRGALKDMNDPSKPHKTSSVFLPAALCDAFVAVMLRGLASNTFRLNSCNVHAFHDRQRLEKVFGVDGPTRGIVGRL